ncbi:hypothetical protein NTJ56_02105 [Burkholderia contaminans]|uniref:hypothetical protein n=1 Tax=Burkholderia contaminans TaxID=488447 RepID=UPI001CF2EBA0|nr:hypothetical protein [Burkholderia contaminans]MCA7920169.1 hypothetical protein [Burkholderia contaminans]UUX37642.1 hypothetical protein NTJ56_02105 [Burkholderia contaminans]
MTGSDVAISPILATCEKPAGTTHTINLIYKSRRACVEDRCGDLGKRYEEGDRSDDAPVEGRQVSAPAAL